MDHFLFWLAAADLLLCVYVGLQLVVSSRSIRDLSTIPPLDGLDLPRVSIVVAARNEERHIKTALESLRRLDYDNLEIVVVDDRSTDSTGAVLDCMAGGSLKSSRQPAAWVGIGEHGGASPPHPLRIVHITELPPGWLGKNHALFRGASEATGEYLLFTDADIIMAPSALRRAMTYARQERLDHLAILLRIVMPNWLLDAFVITFSVYFFAHFQPWRVRDPRSKAHIGVGGFNLLRADAYQKLGTHAALAMRPDDDLKLGKLVKIHGLRQDVLLGPDLMQVRWYASLRELLVGLEKNAFAGVDYNIPLVIASSVAILLLHAFPFIAVLFTSGWTQVLNGLVVALLLGICAHAAHRGRLRMSAVLGFPIAVVLFAFIQWRTMLLNLCQGGIRWRDTFYPLAELRANKV